MKSISTIAAGVVMALSLMITQGCSFSTANMSSLTTSTDKDGKTASTSFKTGDTINAQAKIANNPGKVKVKYTLVSEKGESIKGADVSVDLSGDGVATYALPVSAGLPGGNYKLNADMLNEAGEKKDGKSVSITVAQSAPPASAPKSDEADEETDDK